ncbi:MAG: hypothetical protein GX605_10510 [Chloroflexi bacterium]|nr:hypothetical protein [Chloroflexota bacterium]
MTRLRWRRTILPLAALALLGAACAPGSPGGATAGAQPPVGPAHPPSTLTAALPLPSPLPANSTSILPEATPISLVVLHTNDARGYVEPCG